MVIELGHQAYNALKHNRRRSILTMLGMAWGIATVVLLLAYGTGFERGLQIVPGNFHRELVRNHLAGAFLVFHPRGMRQRHPYGAPVHQKLDVNGVSVARSNGNNQRLVNTVHVVLGPAVYGVEVLIHGCKNYIRPA